MPTNDDVRPLGVRPVSRLTCEHGTMDPDDPNDPCIRCAIPDELADIGVTFSGLPVSHHVEPEPLDAETEAAYERHNANGECQHTDREWRCPTCMRYCEADAEGNLECHACRFPLGAPLLVCEDCGDESQDEGKSWESTEQRIRRTQREND